MLIDSVKLPNTMSTLKDAGVDADFFEKDFVETAKERSIRNYKLRVMWIFAGVLVLLGIPLGPIGVIGLGAAGLLLGFLCGLLFDWKRFHERSAAHKKEHKSLIQFTRWANTFFSYSTDKTDFVIKVVKRFRAAEMAVRNGKLQNTHIVHKDFKLLLSFINLQEVQQILFDYGTHFQNEWRTYSPQELQNFETVALTCHACYRVCNRAATPTVQFNYELSAHPASQKLFTLAANASDRARVTDEETRRLEGYFFADLKETNKRKWLSFSSKTVPGPFKANRTNSQIASDLFGAPLTTTNADAILANSTAPAPVTIGARPRRHSSSNSHLPALTVPPSPAAVTAMKTQYNLDQSSTFAFPATIVKPSKSSTTINGATPGTARPVPSIRGKPSLVRLGSAVAMDGTHDAASLSSGIAGKESPRAAGPATSSSSSFFPLVVPRPASAPLPAPLGGGGPAAAVGTTSIDEEQDKVLLVHGDSDSSHHGGNVEAHDLEAGNVTGGTNDHSELSECEDELRTANGGPRLFKSFEHMASFDTAIKDLEPIRDYEFDYLDELEQLPFEAKAAKALNWTVTVDKEDLKMAKQTTDDNPVVCVRCVTWIKGVPPEVVANHICHIKTRVSWDKSFIDYSMPGVDKETGCEIVYHYLKAPFPASDRDFLQWRRIRCDPKTGISHILSRSCRRDEDFPQETKGAIRANTIISGYIVRPLNPDNHAEGSYMFFIAQNDIRGIVPKTLVNIGAARIPQQWVGNLVAACRKWVAANPGHLRFYDEESIMHPTRPLAPGEKHRDVIPFYLTEREKADPVIFKRWKETYTVASKYMYKK